MKVPTRSLTDPVKQIEKPHVQKAIATVTDEPMTRLNINLPASIHAQFKAKVSLERKSINAVVASWVADYLNNTKSQ